MRNVSKYYFRVRYTAKFKKIEKRGYSMLTFTKKKVEIKCVHVI